MSRSDIEEKERNFLAEVTKVHAQLILDKKQQEEYQNLLLLFRKKMIRLNQYDNWDTTQLLLLAGSAEELKNFLVNKESLKFNSENMETLCKNLVDEINRACEQLSKKTPNWQMFLIGLGLFLVGCAISTGLVIFFISPILGFLLSGSAAGVISGLCLIAIMASIGGLFILPGTFAISSSQVHFGQSFSSMDQRTLDDMNTTDPTKQLLTNPEAVVSDEVLYQIGSENDGTMEQHGSSNSGKEHSSSASNKDYSVTGVSMFSSKPVDENQNNSLCEPVLASKSRSSSYSL